MASRFRGLAELLKSRTVVEQSQQQSQAIAESVRDIRADVRAIKESVTKLASETEVLQRRTEQLVTIHRQDATNKSRMARFARILNADETSSHARKAIARAELIIEPFPHLVIRNLLPDKLYDAMIGAIPPRIFFEDRPVNKQQLTVPPEFAPAYSIAVWEFITEQVVRHAVGPALAERFREPVNEHIRHLCPGVDSLEHAGIGLSVSDGRILLRRPGYVIAPHRDPKWGFLTCIVYLARRGDSPAYGTQLYRLQADSESPNTGPFYVDSGSCQLVKTVPFEPNTALAFLNSAGAHGAAIPADAPPETERYIYQFRIGVDEDSRDTLRQQMPESMRRHWDQPGRY